MLTTIQNQITTEFAETKEAMSNLTDKNDNDITDVNNNDDNYRLLKIEGAFHKIPEGYKYTVTTIFLDFIFFWSSSNKFQAFSITRKERFSFTKY